MANCVHGFPEDQCLICRTLGSGSVQTKTAPTKSTQTKSTKTKPTQTQGPISTDLSELLSGSSSAPLAVRDRGTSEPSRAGGTRGRNMLLAVVAAIVVGGLVLWAFTGVLDLAFHIAEFVAVAVVAGWVGYKAGHARGRRAH